MPDGHKRILGPFTGRKKRKAWNKTRESKGEFHNGNERDNNNESFK